MGNTFRYSYNAQIEILSKKVIVWKVLTDLQNYSKWNPFTPKIETDWQIGHKVLLTVQMKNGEKPIIQKEYIRKLDPPSEISWGMNWGIFLKAERIQRLTKTPNNMTIYFTEDVIHGILAPVVDFLYGKSVQRGFEQVALSLKKYVENS